MFVESSRMYCKVVYDHMIHNHVSRDAINTQEVSQVHLFGIHLGYKPDKLYIYIYVYIIALDIMWRFPQIGAPQIIQEKWMTMTY